MVINFLKNRNLTSLLRSSFFIKNKMSQICETMRYDLKRKTVYLYHNSNQTKKVFKMKFIIALAIALISLTSCQKEALVEPTTAESTTKTLVTLSSVEAVKSFVNGKWAWKESVVKQRTGQTVSMTPTNSGIQKEIRLANNAIVVLENGVQTASETFRLTKTEAGWLFEGGGCSGILYRIGEQLIIVGSMVDKADDYYERAR